MKTSIVVTIGLLAACANHGDLPSRESTQALGVTQKVTNHPFHPDEYVFCDVDNGAWQCPEETSKTEISRERVLKAPLIKNPKKGFSKRDALTKHFRNDDLIGKAIDQVNFDFDSDELDDISTEILQKNLSKITKSGKPILLLGFTDSVGTEKYNDALALNRAERVKAFLADAGVRDSSITTEGNGVCCYLEPNGTDEQRRINRRVEIYFAD